MIKQKLSVTRKIFLLLENDEQKEFRILLLATILAALFQSFGVAAIFPFMSMVLQPEIIRQSPWMGALYSFLGFSGTNGFIIFFGCVLLVLIVVGNLLSTYALWFQFGFVWRINHRLSTALLRKYLFFPYDFFLNHNSAELGKNVLAEVNEMTRNFLIPLMMVITKMLMATAILGLLMLMNPVVTLVAGVTIGGTYTLILGYFRRKLNSAGRKRLKLNTQRYKAVNEAMGGIKEVKILGKESHFLDQFATYSQRFSELQAWQEIIGKVPRHLMEIVSFGGVVVLTLIILVTKDNVQQAIPLISLYAFAGYRLMPALQDAFNSLTTLQFSSAIVDRIHADITIESPDASPVLADGEDVERLPFEDGIRLEHVNYAYPNSREVVVNDVSLSIQRNTAIAIAGPTGSGKTTLVDIILGLLTPDSGRILVDGQAITSKNRTAWQRNLGYVPQQIYLSDDTVTRNIAFGTPDEQIDINAVIRAATIANIHEFITEKMPDGYDTLVGEQGIRLSGGQRQRIGLARALYHDPEIMVLDEATSSLDGITEAAVIRAMENVAKLKTMIIIAHRITTIRNCDVIYVMDKGQITAQGTYEELMANNRQFQAMERSAN